VPRHPPKTGRTLGAFGGSVNSQTEPPGGDARPGDPKLFLGIAPYWVGLGVTHFYPQAWCRPPANTYASKGTVRRTPRPPVAGESRNRTPILQRFEHFYPL